MFLDGMMSQIGLALGSCFRKAVKIHQRFEAKKGSFSLTPSSLTPWPKGISTQGALDALRRQLGPGVDPLCAGKNISSKV